MPTQFRYSLFAMCIAAAVPQFATAQTFEDLEARLRGHPSLIAMDYRASAQEERAVAAIALPDPVVSLGINNFPIYDPSFNAYLPTNKAVGIRQQFPNLAGREARAGEARAMSAQTEAVRDARYAALRAELIALLNRGGRWWMAPLIASIVVLGIGMLFVHAIEYVAPFVYVSPQ